RPGLLKRRPVAARIISTQKVAILDDELLDEIVRGRGEHGLALARVGVEQRFAAPALKRGGKLPAEISGVLETGVDPESAVGRMTVGGVAGDKHVAVPVAVRDGEAQVPEADIGQLAVEVGADDATQVSAKVEILRGRAGRNRGMKEPGLVGVDAAEEL